MTRQTKSFKAWLAAGRPAAWVFVPDKQKEEIRVDKLSASDYAQEQGYSLGDPKGFGI